MVESVNTSNGDAVQPQKSIQTQILEVLPTICEVIFLFIQIFYYIGEAIYRLFKPITPKDVREDIVLVTGAGHGIGKEIALAYAKEGATVVCWDINKENNENTAKEIIKNGGPKPYYYVCDVSKRDEVLKTAKQVKEDIGDVTILINNAGIMPAHPLEAHTPEEIHRIFEINVFAHFWTIEAFLPAMKKFNHGHIVSSSSIAGVVGIPNLVPYCGSKFAVRGYMEALSEELRLNPNNRIKTTTICPYMVDTGLCKKPIIKFTKLMALLQPKFVAQKIMEAQRTDVQETTIPAYTMTLNLVTRLLPMKAVLKVKDFFGSSIDSDL